MEQSSQNERLIVRNNKIIEVVINEIKKNYYNQVELVGIQNTGTVEIPDFKLLIITNDYSANKLNKKFIVESAGIDISTCTWTELSSISTYITPNVSSLTNLEIIYFKDFNSLKVYKEMQNNLKNNMNNKSIIKEYLSYYYGRIMYNYSIIDRTTDTKTAYKCFANIIQDSENIIFMINKTENKSIEIRQNKVLKMRLLPEEFQDIYCDIANITDEIDVKEKSLKIVKSIKELMYNMEIGYINNKIRNPKQERKKIAKENLIGTYEEIWINWKNKMKYASLLNDRYMCFMMMASCQKYYDDMLSKYNNLPDLRLIESYTPYYLDANINHFNNVLNEWRSQYDKYDIKVSYYVSIDKIDDIYKQKRIN